MYNINKNIALHIIDHHKCMPSSTKGYEVHVELKQETWKSKNFHRGDDAWGQGPLAGCRNNSQHGGARKKGRYYIVTRLAWIAAKLDLQTVRRGMPQQLLEEPSQWKIGIGDQSTYIISDIYSQCMREKMERTLKSWAISRTRRWKGSLQMRSSVDFW